jgi:hypothetical protein
MRRPLLILLAAAPALLAAAGAAAQTSYVAATRATVFSTTEEHQADPPSHLIYVENRSTVPVTVFSVSLSGCENVRESCWAKPVTIHVAPGRRELVLRVNPKDPANGFSYRFGFSWHADSSTVAPLAMLAAAGDSSARARLAAIQRSDSLQRTETGTHYNELSRDDFTALAGRAASLRADPDSLVLTPGETASMERIKLLVVDENGVVLGRTRWVRWRFQFNRSVQFVPPSTLVGRTAGRGLIQFSLTDEAQQLLHHPLGDLEYPIVVAYPADPHAPTFAGIAEDAESATPLGCAQVALEDSAQNVVARGRTDRAGAFSLRTPRPGSYRVRVESPGWSPVYGRMQQASADETKQDSVPVQFVDQLLVTRADRALDDVQPARPVAVTTAPYGAARGARSSSTPVVQGVTLGGSESMPILGIIGRAPAGTSWIQFVVDTTGRVDTTSIHLPRGTDRLAVAGVMSVLPRVRFSPARTAGKPTCDLLRMQVNFNPR